MVVQWPHASALIRRAVAAWKQVKSTDRKRSTTRLHSVQRFQYVNKRCPNIVPFPDEKSLKNFLIRRTRGKQLRTLRRIYKLKVENAKTKSARRQQLDYTKLGQRLTTYSLARLASEIARTNNAAVESIECTGTATAKTVQAALIKK